MTTCGATCGAVQMDEPFRQLSKQDGPSPTEAMKSWLSRIAVAQMCCWSDETMCLRLLEPLNTEHVQL